MHKLQQAKSYLNWFLKAKNVNRIHSPFVYKLTEQLRNKELSKHCRHYDRYVATLKRSKTVIETVDFGAGSGTKEYETKMVEVGKLVRQRSHGSKQLHLLYRIARYFQPKTLLEFGTAAGVSTVYLKKSIPDSRMITMEGCASLAHRAEKTLKELKVNNVEVAVGNFDVILPNELKSFDTLDMVFFDGNHRKEPTLKYFNQCLLLTHADSIFIFDDIHWSKGMEEAWDVIKKNKRVTLTIDLFWFGLVFFKNGMEKQNLKVRI